MLPRLDGFFIVFIMSIIMLITGKSSPCAATAAQL
jgi:hypothetical protein